MVLLFALIAPLSLVAQTESAAAIPDEEERSDTLFSVPLTTYDRPLTGLPYTSFYSPFGPGMLGTWDLHSGLNAQVGAGVSVGFGKHNPWRGASFFTDMAALYAMPLSKDGKWTAAAGGYFSNYRLWGRQVNTFGLLGMVDYRINERLNVGAFLMHDFGVLGGHRFGATLPFESPSTTFGADLGIRLTEKAALSLGISFTNYQEPFGPLVPPHFSKHPNR